MMRLSQLLLLLLRVRHMSHVTPDHEMMMIISSTQYIWNNRPWNLVRWYLPLIWGAGVCLCLSVVWAVN